MEKRFRNQIHAAVSLYIKIKTPDKQQIIKPE